MIDAGYFRKKFTEHADQKGAKVRAEIHLRSGAIYEIETVADIEDGYVVLRVYQTRSRDREGGEGWNRRKDPAASPSALDRLVVPYESIAGIHLFSTEEDNSRSVGFRSVNASRGG